jgi:pentapeptide repeat protein
MGERFASAVPEVTLGVAAGLFVAGLICCFLRRPAGGRVGFWQSLGIALISGSSIAAAVFSLQLIVEEAEGAEQEAAERRQAEDAQMARRDNYQLEVSLTSDLTGFDPQGHPACSEDRREGVGGIELPCIDGISFSGKMLENAHLDEIDLHEFDFQDAILRRAHLADTNLSDANLVGADLSRSDLTGADLSGAHLESARFENAMAEDVGSLRGARVNAQTCWPRGFDRIAQTAGLISVSEDGSLGYVCVDGPSVRVGTQPAA